jgi:uncharacterized membrane protein
MLVYGVSLQSDAYADAMTWNDVSPTIQLHLIAALLALTAGIVQLVRTKGTVSHRWLGRFWVTLMLAVAISSFWIQELRHGRYSWIHLLSLWTLFSVTVGFLAIRRGNVRLHGRFMIGTFVGGLLVAGAFAVFGEGRIIGRLLGSG